MYELILTMYTKCKAVQFDVDDITQKEKYWKKNLNQHGNEKKNASNKVMKKKDWNNTAKGKCIVKYVKSKTRSRSRTDRRLT